MSIGTEEVLAGGVSADFVVDVSDGRITYSRNGNRSSRSDVMAALYGAATYSSSNMPILVGGIVAAVLALSIDVRLLLVVIIGVVALLIRSARLTAKRSRVAIVYRLDRPAALVFESISRGVGWLAGSTALWRVTGERSSRPPAPSRERADAHVGRSGAANVITNISVPTIAAAGEMLLFLPDALVIRDRTARFVDCAYSEVSVRIDSMHFTESGLVPRDARHVGTSWLYAKKNGSPDLRRANNRQLPVLEYARVVLSWRNSECVLLVSNADAASHFANAWTQVGAARPEPDPRTKKTAAPTKRPSSEVNVSIPSAAPSALERALQASIDRKRRLDEIERHAATDGERQSSASQDGAWMPEGSSTDVHGCATGSLVYVGKGLRALSRDDTEPSLIDPSLPIDTHANTAGAGMTYWPSYRSISAASRRAYLEWLAGGRSDPNAYIGYVFIFFYGLERRVYEFVEGGGSSAGEVLAIGREVARLLDLYARTSGSFASYGAALLDVIADVEPRARDFCRTPARLAFGPSHALRVTLGELSVAGKPIPAALALDWVRASWSLNTPAARCAGEFELLFHIRYTKKFGDGIVVKPNKTTINLTYRPASSGLRPLAMTRRHIPDITQLSRPVEKLVTLATECTNALDVFSRFVGKNPGDRNSLAAFALLPDELIEATPSADAAALASLVRSRIDDDGDAHLDSRELLQYVRLARPDKVSKNEAMLLAQALEKLGYGIEPDVRLGGPVYGIDGRVVVFRRLADCPSTASEDYATAMLYARLGAIVSTADDEVSNAERTLLRQRITDAAHLTEGERQRLTAHLAWLLDEKPGTNGLRKLLATLTTDKRHDVGHLLIAIAASDGRIDAREVKMLEKLYALIGLEARDLYADMHEALARDDDVVPVARPAGERTGFAIPPKRATAATASGIDMERVRMKIAETRQVSTLLSGIFADEEQPVAPPPAVPQANTIGTLDAAHSELLRRLAQRERWPRDEVEHLAAELSLLTDGALETINDYAYMTAEEAFWEENDPLLINSDVARELVA